MIVTEETARRIADALERLESAIANLKLPPGKAVNPHYLRAPCWNCNSTDGHSRDCILRNGGL